MSHSLKERPAPHASKKYTGMIKGGIILRSWWVILFIALSFGIYTHAVQKKKQSICTLETCLYSLEREKESLLQEKEELLLNINSQSDPAWVELTLMKGLGLVPEGKIKVYFDTAADQNGLP